MTPSPDEIRRILESNGPMGGMPMGPQMPEPAHTFYFYSASGFGVADGSKLPPGVGLVGPAGVKMPDEDVTVCWITGVGPSGGPQSTIWWLDGPGLRRYIHALAERFDPDALDAIAGDLSELAAEGRARTIEPEVGHRPDGPDLGEQADDDESGLPPVQHPRVVLPGED